MYFQVICALKELELNLRNFYEVSRILTKHCANYEAQELLKKVVSLLDEMTHEENLAFEKVLSLQSSVVTTAANFLINTLEEYKDSLTHEEIKSENFLNTLAKSAVLVRRIVELLKKYQFKHFDNMFDVSELDKIGEVLDEVMKKESDDNPLDVVEKMLDVQNNVLKITVKYLKFAVSYYEKKIEEKYSRQCHLPQQPLNNTE